MMNGEGSYMAPEVVVVGKQHTLPHQVDLTIVSFQKKIMTMHSTREVYRGDSNDSKDLLFTVRRSSLFRFKTQLDVFLASKILKDNRDFKIKGIWFKKSCTIYAGNSSTVIAQMHKKHSVSSVVLGKDKFAVMVYPHVDYAFIIALVVILKEINEEGKNNAGVGCGSGGGC